MGIVPSGVGIADFNLDGARDIAVANWNPEAISLHFGNGDGTFQPETQLPSLITRHIPLVVADFNGDAKEDFAVGGEPFRFEVFLSQGDGTFQSPTLYFAPGWGIVADLALGDFNGDGILDLAAAGDEDLGTGHGIVTLFAGVGDGRFLRDISIATNGLADVVVAADFNGDGADDLAVADLFGGSPVEIVLIPPPSVGPCQDADGDGFGDPGSTLCPAGALPDCDDSSAAISPLAPDACDGVDENCDGLDGTDNDSDGFTPCTGDCDETNYNVRPGVKEYCDGEDDDCDGVIDVPGEVAKDMIFVSTGDTLVWSPAPPSTSDFNVYRGPLGPGSFAFNHACFASGLTTPQATDSDPVSVPNGGYYYLVSGSNNCGEGTLGFLSDLQERPNLLPCP